MLTWIVILRKERNDMKLFKRLLTATIAALVLTLFSTSAAYAAPAGEIHGVWISFQDWQTYLKGKTQPQFDAAFSAMCDTVVANGCNSVIVHVRSHNDAVYPSNIYPWSSVMLNGANPGFDPLADMVSIAHAKGLSFHAWVNPYGYRNGVYSGNVALVNQANIVAGVAEIVSKYAVDGIHFDDYFPPLGAAAHNSMISQVYNTCHAAGKVFGISPQGNVENNVAMGADVYTWLSTPGYVDYLAPQIYWTDNYGAAGNVTMYSNRLNQWASMNKAGITMYVGMALYRAGTPMAADKGWTLKNNNLQTQANLAAANGFRGYILFDYADLTKPTAAAELANLRAR